MLDRCRRCTRIITAISAAITYLNRAIRIFSNCYAVSVLNDARLVRGKSGQPRVSQYKDVQEDTQA